MVGRGRTTDRVAGVLAAGVLAVSGCSATSPSATSSIGASRSPTATSSPIPSGLVLTPTAAATPLVAAEVVHFTWSEVPFDGRVADVARDGTRFVAVGSGTDGVAAWTSTDGMNWEQHDVPEVSFGEIAEGVELTAPMGHLIRLGDTLYSFGGTWFNDNLLPAAWRWTDGRSWEVIESQSEFFRRWVTSATASDEALLAVAYSASEGLRGTNSTWLWTSAASWVKTGLASSTDEDIRVYGVAWNDGSYVAVGDVTEPQDDLAPDAWPLSPSIWSSTDGRDWTAMQLPPGISSVCSVTALPSGGFVALGMAGERVASWTSLDAVGWVEGSVEQPAEPHRIVANLGGTPCNMVAFDGGLLASATVEGATLTWTSGDGRSWSLDQRLDIWRDLHASVAGMGDHVLMVGYRDNGARQVLLLGTAGA